MLRKTLLATGLFTFTSLASISTFAAEFDLKLFSNLSKKAMPAVVNIYTTQAKKNTFSQGLGEDDYYQKFFEHFFGGQGGGRRNMPPPPGGGGPNGEPGPKSNALGTGFVIDADGLILTNHHVINGADEIKVKFDENEKDEGIAAELVSTDPELDVALLKIKTTKKLPFLPLGDSSKIEIGDWVMAIGNAYGLGHTVTKGIISFKGRNISLGLFGDYIQTDTPINPGNSGGPLINTNGEVIGINNAILQQAQGIGFAISIDAVKRVLPSLKEGKEVKRGFIGIGMTDVTKQIQDELGLKDSKGALVNDVTEDGPADKAGMKPYDVIVEADGKAVTDTKSLFNIVTQLKTGADVKFKIIRDKKEQVLSLKIGERQVEGKVAKGPSKDKSFSGMTLQNLTPELAGQLDAPKSVKGVVVAGVDFGSPAANAGIMRGDIIVEINKKQISDTKSFSIAFKKSGSNMLRVFRDGNYRIVLVK